MTDIVIVLGSFVNSCLQAEWIIQDSRPPDGWPQNGNITFEDFDLRYREGLPLVLKNINCVITPGEKVNISKAIIDIDGNIFYHTLFRFFFLVENVALCFFTLNNKCQL